ncbi:MAG: signal peptidase I [Fidelibacterota bacterium]
MKFNKPKVLAELRSIVILVIIVLLLKVTLFELYIVPTGSMENTIMTGDFLIGNRFVYGMRTPDWIGIPYTDFGFYIPYLRFPKFQEPKRSDVIIFNFPRDPHQKYVKRCVAGPGDTLQVRNKKVFVNRKEYSLPEHGKYLMPALSPDFKQQDIFLGTQGNRDFFHPLRIPAAGDSIAITPANAKLLLHLMVLDGHELTLKAGTKDYYFTIISPDELYRRKGKGYVYNAFYPKGNLVNPWSDHLPAGNLFIDGEPIRDLDYYVVEQNYYWAMGDNRDDSLDSRYWGFVPEDHILGKALLTYFSLDLDTFLPRLNRIGTIIH